jgi:hypothetical protein
MWVYHPLRMTQWWLEQQHDQQNGALVMFLVLIPVAFFLGVLSVAELLLLFVLENRTMSGCLVLVVLTVGSCCWVYKKRIQIAAVLKTAS